MQLRLDWTDFDAAVDRIAKACRGRPLTGVYGVPRGGLPLAVALSHRLNLPLVSFVTPTVLVVDDIHDSGRTLQGLREKHGEHLGPVWVWATRETAPEGYAAVLTGIGPYWVLYPWEDPNRADIDRLAYEVSRR